MKNKPLVSIITPCYNMEKYIHRLLNSVLNQTYKNIELIVVDDGSKDGSKNIIDRYKAKFENIGMKLVYIYQENAGQSEAINKGLAVMSGDYLTWIDSDDFFKNTSIEKRLEKLEKAGEGYFCITAYELVDESDVENILAIKRRIKPQGKDNFFEDLIRCENIVFAGSVMVKTTDWLKANLSNHIYASTEGQNWQLMLPITYNYECIYIEEPLYIVVEHSDSHSRTKRTFKQNIGLNEECINILKNTLKPMQIVNEDYIFQLIDKVYLKKIILLAKKENETQIITSKYDLYKSKYGEKELKKLKRYIYGNLFEKTISLLKKNKILRKIFHKKQLSI